MFADLWPLAVRLGEGKGSDFESFVKDGQSVAVVPPEEFDAVAAFGAKDKEIARQRILLEVLVDDAGQAIETFAHVCGQGTQKDSARQCEI